MPNASDHSPSLSGLSPDVAQSKTGPSWHVGVCPAGFSISSTVAWKTVPSATIAKPTRAASCRTAYSTSPRSIWDRLSSLAALPLIVGRRAWGGAFARAAAAKAAGPRRAVDGRQRPRRRGRRRGRRMFKQRDFSGRLTARARTRTRGYEILFVSVNFSVGGNREGASVNISSIPFRYTLRNGWTSHSIRLAFSRS
jgi:hypothetical protein